MDTLSSTNPDISVIVRTIGRPFVLNGALSSLRNQTYKNFEVIIVEDGPVSSKEYIYSQFPDLKIQYFFTGFQVGRNKAGNIGLSNAKGKYLIFLDDDDIFFPEHLEILYRTVENQNVKAAYSIAYEVQTEVISTNPYQYKEKAEKVVFNQPFNLLLLLWKNYIPIQTILFHRTLYEELGGFDESLEIFEDWDLWIRYATATRFIFVPKITSKYRVPCRSSGSYVKRWMTFSNASFAIREKQKDMNITVNVSDTVKEIEELYEANIYEYIRVFSAKGPIRGFFSFLLFIKRYISNNFG
jgi:glycosyltransferase involved in cell wall biosynthesis